MVVFEKSLYCLGSSYNYIIHYMKINIMILQTIPNNYFFLIILIIKHFYEEKLDYLIRNPFQYQSNTLTICY